MEVDLDIDFDVELALKFIEIVNDRCDNVPAAIGIVLAQEVFLHTLGKVGINACAAGKRCRDQYLKGGGK